jgi:hypothetical protein
LVLDPGDGTISPISVALQVVGVEGTTRSSGRHGTEVHKVHILELLLGQVHELGLTENESVFRVAVALLDENVVVIVDLKSVVVFSAGVLLRELLLECSEILHDVLRDRVNRDGRLLHEI